MGPDPIWPDPSLLLTSSKKEANLPLTRRLFDPTPKRFFWPEEKNIEKIGEIFQTLTQNIDGWPDPSRVKKFDLDPSLVKDNLIMSIIFM